MIKICYKTAKKYNADIMIARTNLQNYLRNSVGVGEHSDIVGECDKLIAACSDAAGKVETLKKFVESLRSPVEKNESSNNRK